mgnify:CR=1 FL=1
MCIDASCWKYLDNQGTYLRYSLNGPFYDRAEYANQNSNRNGLKNIQKRAAEINGTLQIKTAPGMGTTLLFQVPVA